MSDIYTDYHPRWLRTRVSTYWWLKQRSYLAFISREVSSVFVGWFVVYLLLLIRAVAQGALSYERFLGWSARPPVLLLNLLTLAFVTFHGITWFNLAPQAMVVRIGGSRVPGSVITASNYAAWVAASALIAWLLLGA
jgi:succinate dehydrogenase subunit C